MKHWMKRISAATLALSLGLGQAALASEALGHDLHAGSTPLSEGTALTRSYFWSDTYSDLRTERYLTYTPNRDVMPAVAYGDTVLKKATLSAMAGKLEEAGKRVVGGTNGDFYVLATGQPLGLVVTDGVLRSSASYHSAVGFRADGTAFVGTPGLTVTASMLGERLTVFGGVNKIRQVRTADGGGLTLLTEDFGATTLNTSPGVDVFLRLATEEDEARWAAEAEKPVETPEPTETPVATESLEPTESPAESPVPSESPAEENEEDATLPKEAPLAENAEGEDQDKDPGEDITPQTEDPGADLPRSEKIRIGNRVRCVVDYVTEASGANPIPKGGFVLTMNGKDDPGTLNMLKALKPGDKVDLDVTSADPRWAEATEALGAMYRLLENGKLGPNLNAERTARTAVGIRPDGTVLFYTMDGKRPGVSVGATCTQVAQRLLELGCVEAVGLDGGGSTTIGVTYPDKPLMEVVNSPSDGAQRPNSTALFLTTELEPTGEPGSLMLTPGDALLLAGAELELSARIVDTHYFAQGPAEDALYTAEGAGRVTETGLFTTGAEKGRAVVTAELDGVSGKADLTVVDTPDNITVYNEENGGTVAALSLDPGETVDLTASAVWRNLPLLSQDDCYIWSCDPAVGTVDENGTFTASLKSGEGNLTVTAGEKTVTVPVNVAGHIYRLEDMEGANTAFTDGEGTWTELETTLNYVRAGYQSLKVSYDVGEAAFARLEAQVAVPAGERWMGLWIWGDESHNSLTARFATEEGDLLLSPVAGLSFTGWKHVLFPVPEGARMLTSLDIIYGGRDRRSGTVWLDQLTSANEDLEDFTPTVDVKVQGTKLTAAVSDNLDRAFPAGAVLLKQDGVLMPATWDGEKGVLTATLPDPGAVAHRVTVTAVDASGNVGRASVDAGEGGTLLFADLEDHWAAHFANYLYEQGVTKGVSTGDVRYYQPDANITRAEFFTMTARWMGLDLAEYEGVELPFADTGEVPEWALSAVKAMYARGVVQGSLEGGALYAHPLASINRAEAMTILGRTQMRGWPEVELDGFTDRDQAPAWAEAYIRSLVGQGAINGFEDGTLRPGAPMTRGQVAKVLYTLR